MLALPSIHGPVSQKLLIPSCCKLECFTTSVTYETPFYLLAGMVSFMAPHSKGRLLACSANIGSKLQDQTL
jgi:hypothetical protein